MRQWWIGHDIETLRFVYAPDLVREPSGRWVVIEDNVGCVGGCADSYFVLQTYQQAAGLLREPLFPPDLSYAIKLWLDALGVAPWDPGVVAMLSDGDALAAYLPKRFKEDERRTQLVRQLGVQVIDDAEFERICQDPKARARLKAIVNLGVPSRKTWWLAHDVAFNQLRVPLLNSPGTLLLGHKAFLPFVGEMINFYCGEEPILQSPLTRLLRDGVLPRDLENWVLKTATGCQGDGVFILKSQPADQLEKIRSLAQGFWAKTPAIIQRHVKLSRLRVGGLDTYNTYDVEVRVLAYVLGWQHVFVGEHSIGKLMPTGSSNPVQTVFSGASYVPVSRESIG
jgi:carboxylate-amine ligase